VLDGADNLYFTDTFNSRIRKIDATTGIITTVVGNGAPQFNGDGLSATETSISPTGLAFDKEGNLFVGDLGNSRIRRVDAKTNIVTTVAGNGVFDFGGDGGPAIDASLVPFSIAFDNNENLI